MSTIIIFGWLGMLGAILYAIGDVLLLASKARLEDFPKLRLHAKILSGTERMVDLPHWRLLWGGLLGVFATPFILAGFLQIFMSSRMETTLMFPPFLFFALATIIAPFVHGSFFYLGEYVQALNKVDESSQPVIVDMLRRHRKIMIITYAFLLVCILIASVWFSVLVGMDRTYFPVWMAAVNPVTMFLAWMLIKRILPRFVQDWTEGAGFNIAYLLFFIFTTFTFAPELTNFTM